MRDNYQENTLQSAFAKSKKSLQKSMRVHSIYSLLAFVAICVNVYKFSSNVNTYDLGDALILLAVLLVFLENTIKAVKKKVLLKEASEISSKFI